MASRTQRLKQLLDLQERLKQMHEMKRAGHLAAAAAADRDIAAVMARRTGDESLSDLFPDVYARFVDRTLERKRESERLSQEEAGKIAAAKVRAGMLERAWRGELDIEERRQQEIAGLETVERKLFGG